MLVACVSILHAQTAITAPGDVKPGKIYWFESGWLSMATQRYITPLHQSLMLIRTEFGVVMYGRSRMMSQILTSSLPL